jgi:hypothetical protein
VCLLSVYHVFVAFSARYETQRVQDLCRPGGFSARGCDTLQGHWWLTHVSAACLCLCNRTSTGGSSQSRSSSRYEAAAGGSPGTSPVRQLTLAAQGASPRLGTTPGSVYSTPTLTLGQASGLGAHGQVRAHTWICTNKLHDWQHSHLAALHYAQATLGRSKCCESELFLVSLQPHGRSTTLPPASN